MKLAADANVLLSAVIGGRARLAITHPQVEELLTTATVYAEVEEYALELGRKKNIPSETLMLAVASLPVSIVDREIYKGSIANAKREIGKRDPDDVELLALAMHFKIPVWSNDNDFLECGVDRVTTAELLKILGVESKG
ncbi:MAG TPA: PIN domain-containing protein [Terracidiphilus sp.]|nr:PIN domain-containing protein [Terracidiphilus sp.]